MVRHIDRLFCFEVAIRSHQWHIWPSISLFGVKICKSQENENCPTVFALKNHIFRGLGIEFKNAHTSFASIDPRIMKLHSIEGTYS